VKNVKKIYEKRTKLNYISLELTYSYLKKKGYTYFVFVLFIKIMFDYWKG